MGISKKVCIIYGIIICLLWLGNVGYYITTEIKEPLFIKQYTEAELYPYESFSICYVTTNKNVSIGAVTFPEISEEEVWVEERSVGEYGKYIVKELWVNEERFLHAYPHLRAWTENPDSEPISLTKIVAHTRRDEGIEASIGSVQLFPVRDSVEKNLYIPNGRRSSRGDNRRQIKDEYILQKDVTIAYPEGKFKEEIEEVFDILINDEPLEEVVFPLRLKAGDNFKIVYQLKENTVLTRCYETGLQFVIEADDGKKEVISSNMNESIYHLDLHKRSLIGQLQREGK